MCGQCQGQLLRVHFSLSTTVPGNNLRLSDLAAGASYHLKYLTDSKATFLPSYIIYFIIICMYQNQWIKTLIATLVILHTAAHILYLVVRLDLLTPHL